jgi:hypothetical protein
VSAGFPVDKSQLDLVSGQLSRQIENWAPDLLKIKGWLDGISVEQLTQPPFSYTVDEANLVKSAFTEMGGPGRRLSGRRRVDAGPRPERLSQAAGRHLDMIEPIEYPDLDDYRLASWAHAESHYEAATDPECCDADDCPHWPDWWGDRS